MWLVAPRLVDGLGRVVGAVRGDVYSEMEVVQKLGLAWKEVDRFMVRVGEATWDGIRSC